MFTLVGKQILGISVNDIIPSRFEPRTTFEQNKLRGLAESIKRNGMLQPLLLIKNNNNYEIVIGTRRYNAAKMIGLTTVPAVILEESNEKKLSEICLIEKLLNQDLSPIDEAKSYQKLQQISNFNLNDLAMFTGKSENVIINKLNLLNLSTKCQQALIDNLISEGHAKILFKLNNLNQQDEVLDKIITERMPVKDTDEYVNNMKFPSSPNLNQTLRSYSGNIDTINLKDLNNESLNIKTALNELNVINKTSDLFNDNELSIEEKKEDEKNMDMNSLNQAAQSNMNVANNNTTIPDFNAGNQSKFFPSMEESENIMGANTINNSQATSGVVPTPMPSIIGDNQFQQISPTTNNGNINNNDLNNTNFAFPEASSIPEPSFQNQSDFRIEPVPSVVSQSATNYETENQPSLANSIPTFENIVPPSTTSNINLEHALVSTRGLVSVLQNMGYNVIAEENDGTGEYQITIKIKK